MQEPVLEARNISKRFGGVQALRAVSWQIWPGTVQCLIGENGCGKSTLVKILSGVERPDAGVIKVGGTERSALTPREAIGAGIEVVYQDLSLFPNLSVKENIAVAPFLAGRRHRYSPGEASRLAAAAAAKLGISLDLAAKVGDLPVSGRQLVAICRSLAENARVVFMDEPTTALTWREVQALFVVMRRLVEHEVAVVFVGHKFNEILEIAQHITVMRNGQIVVSGEAADFDRASLSRAMTGHEVASLDRPQTAEIVKPPVLQVSELSSKGAFEHVSLSIGKHEVVGLTGLLGSGHAEVGEALFGIRPVSSGQLRIGGEPRHIGSVADALRYGVGYVPGDRLNQGLFLTQSVARNLAAANIDRLKRRAGLVKQSEVRDTARMMIKKLAIKAPSEQTAVRNLSGGHQQRVLLGKWLLRDPALLIVNGPTVGVDIGSKREILQILRDLATQGTAVLVISDDIPEVVEVCDRVLVMREGRLVAEFEGDRVTEEAILPEIVAA
jgi:simple sugar transport system ATP-binding protein